MHRVELKVIFVWTGVDMILVPNAPCGVESPKGWVKHFYRGRKVPNAPCGVESNHIKQHQASLIVQVPNAPCGVESQQLDKYYFILCRRS